MKLRCRLIAVLVASGLLTVLVFCVVSPRPEPIYRGRSLSAWAETYFASVWPPAKEEAAEAIRSIGSHAVPHLVAWVRYEPPQWRIRLAKLAPRLPRVLYGRWMVIDWKDRRAATALRAFEPLGPKAASAIPDITRLLKDAKSSEMACRAVRILAFIGRDALGPLIDALTKQTGLVRRSILYLITTEDCLRTNARPFIPAFVRCLNDPDRVVGTKAAILLGKLKGDPEIVLPALVKSLQDSRGDVRRE